MKAFDHVLVLENDEKEIPSSLQRVLSKQHKDTRIEYWFGFNISLSNDPLYVFDKLKEEATSAFIVTQPSFVGYDNEFQKYVYLFLKLIDKEIKLDIAILFNNEFKQLLIEFINQNVNASKLEVLRDQIKSILEYHSIREIIVEDDKIDIVKINYEDL